MIKRSLVNKKIYLFFLLIFSLTCAPNKHTSLAKEKDNCNCEAITDAYALIDYRYNKIDSVIGPKVIWYNNGFEENEEIDLLKKCTNLEIQYIENRKGYYLVKSTHLEYVKTWIKKQCPSFLDRIDVIKARFEKGNADSVDYKVDEIIIEKRK